MRSAMLSIAAVCFLSLSFSNEPLAAEKTKISFQSAEQRAAAPAAAQDEPTNPATRCRSTGITSASNHGLRFCQPAVRQLGCGVGKYSGR